MEHPPRKLSDLVLESSEQSSGSPYSSRAIERGATRMEGQAMIGWLGSEMGCSASRMERVEDIRGCAHQGSGTAGVVESRALTKRVLRGV